MESGGGGVTLISGHEWREDEGGDADRDGCIVVAEVGDGEGGLVIDGLDVLHVGERVVVAFIGAEIEAADLWDGVGLAVGADEEAEILWAGAGRGGGGAGILRPGAGVEDLPIVEAAVRTEFDESGGEAAERSRSEERR